MALPKSSTARQPSRATAVARGVPASRTGRAGVRAGAAQATPSLSAIAVERKPALAEVVAERIREAIVFGELALGEAVSEERLASLLHVSRTPIREALMSLQFQGLIDIRPQRGSFVFQPTQQDIEEMCDFRVMLETGALRLAIVHAPGETRRLMQEAETALEEAEARGDALGAAKADEAFHEALFATCGNRFLTQSYDLISGRVGAVRYFARGSETSRRSTGREHRAILKALARSDVAAASELLTAHILAMRGRFKEHLENPTPTE